MLLEYFDCVIPPVRSILQRDARWILCPAGVKKPKRPCHRIERWLEVFRILEIQILNHLERQAVGLEDFRLRLQSDVFIQRVA